MNITYNDMNSMSFFEILTILDVYKENMEQQQKANEKENKRMEKQMQSMQKQYNYNDMQKQMQSTQNQFKAPSFNPPNFSVPKI